jgi:hypothetical protein
VAENAADFKTRLTTRAGLSLSAVEAAWPEWWSDAADASPSARAELRFTVARKLGLDARSLLEEGEPRFTWDDSARFKGFSGNLHERPVIASFGTALARMLVEATPTPPPSVSSGLTAAQLRRSILANRADVGLIELLMAAWGLGIPVVHLRVYPLTAKRMCAMSVRVGARFAVLIARDATYPSPVAFHLAHELGHIFLDHLSDGRSIVDVEDFGKGTTSADPEERSADAFALELLTGRPRPDLVITGEGRSARQLSSEAKRVGAQERIEPGIVALAYGHATGNWATAIAALGRIYSQPYDVWMAINQLASRQLQWNSLPDESESFVRAVMGAIHG